MRSNRFRRAGGGLLMLGAAALGLLVLPLPGGSGDAARRPAADSIEARAARHFGRITTGGGLDRAFPAMPVRPDNPTTPEKVALGRLLFFDPILSADNTLSCAHCHHPALGFADGRALSMGRGGRGAGPRRRGGTVLRRHAPTVWNAAYNAAQFWDGRAADLETQAAVPLTAADEMGAHPDTLVRELRALPAYARAFDAAFGGTDGSAVTFRHVTHALAAFERTLVSRDAAFDRYARGDRLALDAAQRRGLNLFRSLKTRCFECHNLPTFNDAEFKVVGVPNRPGETPDLGRGEVAGPGYAHAFKVPTLRNVALTAPYMHNGLHATLEEVVDFYSDGGGAAHGLEAFVDDKVRPFAITPEEKRDLVAFLHALTDTSAMPEVPEHVPSGLPVAAVADAAQAATAGRAAGSAARRRPDVPRRGRRLVVEPGRSIQDAIDVATPGDTVLVLPGVYHETLTLDGRDLTLLGAGTGDRRPVLDGRGVLSDGLIGSGDDLEIRGFVVRDYTANGLMVNLGTNVVFRDLHLEDTGLYGVYPVEVAGVRVEGCTVTGARDAGIYVGQSRDVVVRGNRAWGNVTGIEIENSVDVLVEDNDVYDNTGGILVFLLPNNPSKVARRCLVRGNRVYANNRDNFADATAIVSRVPSGTGVMILGADETEVTENEIRENASFGVAVVGLDAVFGAGTAYDVDPWPDGNVVHGNRVARNGTAPGASVTEAGFAGADLLWDLSGRGNGWDQAAATRLPYVLPGRDWSSARRRANRRRWQLARALL